MTSSRKKLYTYMAVMDIIVHKVQNSYGYDVKFSLRDIEEYNMEGKRPTIITSQETDTNTKETYKIGPSMLYQSEITNYIKIIIEFKQNLRKSYIVVC